ncbi:hypothetical protein BK141_13015 [Paenibacillus sp. FSL R5-0765]|nr:hypothetical protein BK141_13015 [Paenibacillus sp. FSL R5-0765]
MVEQWRLWARVYVRSGGHFAAVPCVNAAWPYREAGVAGCFAFPAGGTLPEVPSGLRDVRLFWTQKSPVPGKGRGYTRVTTLILFITNHIQASLGMLCHQQRLCPAKLLQGAVITYGLRFGLHTAIIITASASLLRGDIRL